MIRRLFWLGAGVAVGVVVVRALTRAAESYSPGGIAASAQRSASGLLGSVRGFLDDVRDGMAEREEEIYLALARNAESGGLTPEHLLDADLSEADLAHLAGLPYPYDAAPAAEPGRGEGDTDR